MRRTSAASCVRPCPTGWLRPTSPQSWSVSRQRPGASAAKARFMCGYGEPNSNEPTAPQESGPNRASLGDALAVLIGERDADLAVLALVCLVNEVKNADGGSQPFRSIIERPDGIGLGKPFHKSLNQEIRRRAGFLGAILLGDKQLGSQAVSLLPAWHRDSAPCGRSALIRLARLLRYSNRHFRNDRRHDGYSPRALLPPVIAKNGHRSNLVIPQW